MILARSTPQNHSHRLTIRPPQPAATAPTTAGAPEPAGAKARPLSQLTQAISVPVAPIPLVLIVAVEHRPQVHRRVQEEGALSLWVFGCGGGVHQ